MKWMWPMVPLLLTFAFVLAATSIGGFYFPWWWPAVPGLLAGFWNPDKPVRLFLVTFLAAGFSWAAVAVYFDVRNEGILSARVAPLFHLPGGVALIAATAVVGGTTAGLGAILGDHFRRFWRSLMLALAAEDVVIPPDDEKFDIKG